MFLGLNSSERGRLSNIIGPSFVVFFIGQNLTGGHFISARISGMGHAMNFDTRAFPRTIVCFAIVMLGTVAECYAPPILTTAYLKPLRTLLTLYGDYLDSRLCSSGLVYGCGWCRGMRRSIRHQIRSKPAGLLVLSTMVLQRTTLKLGLASQSIKITHLPAYLDLALDGPVSWGSMLFICFVHPAIQITICPQFLASTIHLTISAWALQLICIRVRGA